MKHKHQHLREEWLIFKLVTLRTKQCLPSLGQSTSTVFRD